MKADLKNRIQSISQVSTRRNFAREYLQSLMLSSMQNSGAMIPLAFHGGTALRFLYGINRYSEDLDFALEGARQPYNFRTYLKNISTDLQAQGYRVEIKVNDQRTVQSAFVRFPGLLYELGVSPNQDEKLAVKIEVDTKPPDGAVLATTVIRRQIILNLQHHDRASLLAGKLHAILQRSFLKGRDIYDLLWYLSSQDWPMPNIKMLHHALRQTGWEGQNVREENWREIVRTRLMNVDWKTIVDDVRPFVEFPGELDLLTQDILLGLLS